MKKYYVNSEDDVDDNSEFDSELLIQKKLIRPMNIL